MSRPEPPWASGQPGGVGAVDEAAEVVRGAVQPGRGEQVHAVVAPAEAAGEVGDGHDLEDGDAEVGEVGQGALGGRPGALRREGADVQLVEDLVPPPAPPPAPS